MLKPLLPELLASTEKRAVKRTFASDWDKSQWVVKQYMHKGGTFADVHSVKPDAAQKDDALKTIEKALVKKGFKKINDNFIIGTSTLSFRTLSNLLEISRQFWYQLSASGPVVLKSAAGNIDLNKRDYYGLTWQHSSALIFSSKAGCQPVEVPREIAFALIHASRQVNMKEARFR